MTTNKPTCSNELDWLAFCYAAGELSEQDTVQFESRLATDQPAREALARAVELTQTVVAAESQSGQIAAAASVSLANRTRKNWNTGLIWVAMGGVAAMLLAILNFPAPVRKPSVGNQQQLAFAWTEARAQMANAAEADVWPALDGLGEIDAETTTDLVVTEVAEAPSWLTAALLGQMTPAPVAEALNNGPLEN